MIIILANLMEKATNFIDNYSISGNSVLRKDSQLITPFSALVFPVYKFIDRTKSVEGSSM